MEKIAILSAVRTPIGRLSGALSSLSAPELGAVAVREAVKRAGLKPGQVNELVMGNVVSAGVGQNPARQAALLAGLPNETDAFTVNKVCGSGMQSVILACQSLLLGEREFVVAGGMESMSNAPFLDHSKRKGKTRDSTELLDAMVHDGLMDCYSHKHMGALAELLAEKFSISRKESDEFAFKSHQKALRATDEGFFRNEITPVEVVAENGSKNMVAVDEQPRHDTSLEKLAKLKPSFKGNGDVTAGNSSSVNDGAAVLVLCTEGTAKKHGLTALAFIDAWATAALDPSYYGLGPVHAVGKLLEKTRSKITDYDLVEVNEAFAVQALAVARELGIDLGKLNVNGGAVALGHPIGSSGARIIVTLVHALKRLGKRKGIASLCLGGGGGNAVSVSLA
ncbi:MAG TPA: acetyl-CoA C-acetyltransferase [archaeon]|nr:acetyl-CoA C-acetyltransferase [archaeon]